MGDYKMTRQAYWMKNHHGSEPCKDGITIPAGTIVTPADDLPRGKYWRVARWPGASDKAIGWGRRWGFLLLPCEVEHAPIGELWSQAEALGWENPITSQGDDVDPEEVDKAEREALEFLVKQWEV